MAQGLGINIVTGRVASASSYVVMDPAALAKVLREPGGEVYRFMFKLGDQVKARAQAEVGVDTGNLRDHIVKRMVQFPGGFGCIIIADVKYAIWHHEGSKAVEGKLMVFEAKDGTIVFTMRRKAIPPNRFFIRALDYARTLL